MSRLTFTADVHIGNPTAFGGPAVAGVNERGRLVLNALERAVQQADGSDALIICGDLFDTSNPSPQLIAEVQRILLTSMKVFVLMGNHDMVSDSPGDNALGPLLPLSNILPVERPETYFIEGTALFLVPFQAGDCREWFPQVVASLASTPMPENAKRVLVFHLGVIDKETPSFLAKAHDAIEVEVVRELMEAHDIDFAFCGNWHSPRKWKAPKGAIVQCGALAPTGWDNPGFTYGQLWTLDTGTGLLSRQMIPGPRFLTAESMADAESAIRKGQLEGHKVYLTLKGEAADEASLEAVREMGVKARSVADGEAAREATHAAAKAVKGAATLSDALARYVKEMPVEEGVDREQVRTLAQKYLSLGGTA